VTRRCLVVHPGALGDVLLAAPALAHLGALGFATTLGATSRLLGLFARSGLVDGVRDLDGLGLHRLFVEPADPGARSTVASFDALVCWLGARDLVFRRNLAALGRPTVIARATPPPGTGRHASRHLVESLAPLGPLPVDLPAVRVRVAEADGAAAEAWLAARGIGPAEAIVLQPGAGSAVKVWPGFATLARRLRDAGVPVVTLAGPADGTLVDMLLAAGAVAEDTVARDWRLPELGALLSLARATIGNDSGPTHLAAAIGCPTVALFGPTDPEIWAPLGSHVRVVGARPVGTWADVDQAEAALRSLLGISRTPGPPEPAGVAVAPAWP
jgi:heptosyltransferase-3